MKLSFWLTTMVLAVAAEPPAPDPQHGALASQEHGPPGQFGDAHGRHHGRPSPQYGALASQEYGPPGQFGDARGRHHGRPSPQYGAPPSSGYGGGKDGYDGDGENAEASYEFQYEVTDAEAGLRLGHQEAREGEVARGRYHVLLPDGRTQTVEYVADQDGYRPKVTYQEPEAGYERGPGRSGGYRK